eukprot:s408_g8.t1
MKMLGPGNSHGTHDENRGKGKKLVEACSAKPSPSGCQRANAPEAATARRRVHFLLKACRRLRSQEIAARVIVLPSSDVPEAQRKWAQNSLVKAPDDRAIVRKFKMKLPVYKS